MNKRVNSIDELENKCIVDGIIDSEDIEAKALGLQIDYNDEEKFQDDGLSTNQEDENSEDIEEQDDLIYEISTEGEKLQFSKVYHTERSEKFGCLSDGEIGVGFFVV